MEFIPLERYSKRIKNKKSIEKQKSKKSIEDETSEPVTPKKTELKVRAKTFQKKNVKNKYKETIALKQKKRVPKKKNQKKKEEEEEAEEEDDDEKEEAMQVDEEEEDDNQGEDEEDEEDEEDDEDEDKKQEKDEQEAFKRKCQEMDEKKKNRLYLQLKDKILNKSQVLKLHPDIKDVIMPRKKNSRWCWAVFTSEEKANQVLAKLIKTKGVWAKKPTSYDEVSKRRKEKMKTVLRKKDARKKLQKMWM